MTLYRPVGRKEMDLIAATGFAAFPPRLDWQTIFYPVVTEAHAPFNAHVVGAIVVVAAIGSRFRSRPELVGCRFEVRAATQRQLLLPTHLGCAP
jgi:hypothetical protein